jgi:hypothetical protein
VQAVHQGPAASAATVGSSKEGQAVATNIFFVSTIGDDKFAGIVRAPHEQRF